MDILIKGMEMPSCCYDCFMALNCEERDKADTIDRPKGLFNRRISTCPLIPVPEHGDLIDRSALLKEFEHLTAHPTGYDVVSKIFDAPVVLERTT